jgi:hypothetical protein
MSNTKFIEKIVDNYVHEFGKKPRDYTSPLEKGDHPEIDTSEFLESNDIHRFQSLIGSAQWAIALRCFDIMPAVMTLSSFRAAPWKVHLQRACRIIAYLNKMKHGMIWYQTSLPNYSDVPEGGINWDSSIYCDAKELIPDNAPKPLGKEVITTTYQDANLYHNLLDGRSVTGIIHFLNTTPIDWFSKKQGTVKTSAFGSEFVSAWTATEQVMDLW